MGALFPGTKQRRREANHPSTSGVKVIICGAISPLPPLYIWRAQRKLCCYAQEFLACVTSRFKVVARSRRKRGKIPPIGAFVMERVKVGAVCRYTYLLTLIAGNRTDVL